MKDFFGAADFLFFSFTIYSHQLENYYYYYNLQYLYSTLYYYTPRNEVEGGILVSPCLSIRL